MTRMSNRKIQEIAIKANRKSNWTGNGVFVLAANGTRRRYQTQNGMYFLPFSALSPVRRFIYCLFAAFLFPFRSCFNCRREAFVAYCTFIKCVTISLNNFAFLFIYFYELNWSTVVWLNRWLCTRNVCPIWLQFIYSLGRHNRRLLFHFMYATTTTKTTETNQQRVKIHWNTWVNWRRACVCVCAWWSICCV